MTALLNQLVRVGGLELEREGFRGVGSVVGGQGLV